MLDKVGEKLSFTSFDAIVRGEVSYKEALMNGIKKV